MVTGVCRDAAEVRWHLWEFCSSTKVDWFDGESKGGAAAASAHNDGDVAAMLDNDDFVLEGEGDEASGGWSFGFSSMCAVLESTGSLLLDSGSDEHLCSPKFADLIPTDPDRSLLKLKDVQQNDLTISGPKTVPLLVGPSSGNMRWKLLPHSVLLTCVTIFCRWRNWCEKRFHFLWVPVVAQWREMGSVPLYVERNSLRVEAHVLQSPARSGYVEAGLSVTDYHIKDVNVKQSHTSSSAGSAGDPSTEVPTAPAPVLRTWSTIKELHSRLRELGAPMYGTKDELLSTTV